MSAIQLDPNQRAALARCEKRCQELLADCDRLERCGHDVSVPRQALTDLMQGAQAYRREFGAGPPQDGGPDRA